MRHECVRHEPSRDKKIRVNPFDPYHPQRSSHTYSYLDSKHGIEGMLKIFKTQDLENSLQSSIAHHVHEEFGHIPIVKNTQWAVPDWTIVYYHEGQLACFYNIVEREILIDMQPRQAAGINNVITPKRFRGKGLASKMLKETEGFLFTKLQKDIGVLLCADALIPFYSKLGWYKINGPVSFKQRDETLLWQANTMLLTPGTIIQPLQIDLNGLPW